MRPLLPPRKQAGKVVEKRGGKGSFSSSSDQKLPSLLATSSVLSPSLLPKPNHATACDAGRRRRRRRRRKGGPFPGHKSRNLLPPLASLSPSPFSPPAQPSPLPLSITIKSIESVTQPREEGRKGGEGRNLSVMLRRPPFPLCSCLRTLYVCIAKKRKLG